MKVFLSYSHYDDEFASALAAELTRRGLCVFRDVERIQPGEVLSEKVSQALSECSGFCVLVSPHAAASRWVQLELGAAFVRWTDDPHFRLCPVVLDPRALPRILSGIRYVDAASLTPQRAAEQVVAGLLANTGASTPAAVDWDALLAAIEHDQFCDESTWSTYGGWSRSYAPSFLPLAFPERVPETVSFSDSVTITHWMVRGLCSLRRIIGQTSEDPALLDRIASLLARARVYLLRHFDGRGAGVMRDTIEGPRILRDVRHSSGFAQALLHLGREPLDQIRMAIEYALVDFSLNDGRLSSLAEVGHLIGLLRGYPELGSPAVTPELVRDVQSTVEAGIAALYRPLGEGHNRGGLVGHRDQWHMAPFYTWLVLDASGDLLLTSTDGTICEMASGLLRGLDQLAISRPDGSLGYPLTLDGHADLGASAQIAEALLRLRGKDYLTTARHVAEFVCGGLSAEYLSKYRHHELLWSVPYFLERYWALAEQ